MKSLMSSVMSDKKSVTLELLRRRAMMGYSLDRE
jgi:hypothetical protein